MTKAMKLLALLFAGLLFLAACGNDDDSGNTTTTAEDSGSDDSGSDDSGSDDSGSDDSGSDGSGSPGDLNYEPENSEDDIATVVGALNESDASFPTDDPYTICFADQLINEYGSVDGAVDGINTIYEVSEEDITDLSDIGDIYADSIEFANASLTCADLLLDQSLSELDEQLEDVFGE